MDYFDQLGNKLDLFAFFSYYIGFVLRLDADMRFSISKSSVPEKLEANYFLTFFIMKQSCF